VTALTQISPFIIIATFALVASCADTAAREDKPERVSNNECPAWKIIVVEDDRIYCTDPDVLEREREIIEAEERW